MTPILRDRIVALVAREPGLRPWGLEWSCEIPPCTDPGAVADWFHDQQTHPYGDDEFLHIFCWHAVGWMEEDGWHVTFYKTDRADAQHGVEVSKIDGNLPPPDCVQTLHHDAPTRPEATVACVEAVVGITTTGDTDNDTQ